MDVTEYLVCCESNFLRCDVKMRLNKSMHLSKHTEKDSQENPLLLSTSLYEKPSLLPQSDGWIDWFELVCIINTMIRGG